MSIEYCDFCDCHIDTDFDAEHFDVKKPFRCVEEEQEKAICLQDGYNFKLRGW